MGSLIAVETRSDSFVTAGMMPGTRCSRILLAEDDSEMRQLIALCLAKEGHDVVQAADGVQLVAHVTDSLRDGRPVDLVISDVRMPGLTGFEAIQWLRSLGCRAPVVLITAFGDARTHMESVRRGVVRVLDKPFDLDELRSLAGSLLGNAHRGRPPIG
jgi:DNA-binding response OmpR family regulator